MAIVDVRHVRHLAHRTNELAVPLLGLHVAVALEAPPHAEGLFHPHLFHLVDATVTGHAADAGGHVDAVVEVHVIRQLVNSDPLHRSARLPAHPDRLEELRVGLHHLGAVHAGLGRGDHRQRRALDVHVAVPAVQTQLAHVQPVGVGDGLLRRVADLREVRREVVPDQERHRDESQAGGCAHDQRQLVQGAREDLHWGQGRAVREPAAESATLLTGNAGVGLGVSGLLRRSKSEQVLGNARAYTKSGPSETTDVLRKICAGLCHASHEETGSGGFERSKVAAAVATRCAVKVRRRRGGLRRPLYRLVLPALLNFPVAGRPVSRATSFSRPTLSSGRLEVG